MTLKAIYLSEAIPSFLDELGKISAIFENQGDLRIFERTSRVKADLKFPDF